MFRMPHEIAPRSGVAFTIDAGQRLTVIDPQGGQVADLPADAATSGAVAYVNKEDFGPQVLEDLWSRRDAGSSLGP